MSVSHLSLFYDTRSNVHIKNTDPSNSSKTALNETPEVALVRYEDGTERFVDSLKYKAPNGKGYETEQFLLERAMLDPDATVIPKE